MANEELREANIESALEAALVLFEEHGIQNVTREMIVRKSGLSRRSVSRYFPSMCDCVVQTADLCARDVYRASIVPRMLASKQYTADIILKEFLGEMEKVLIERPTMYILHSEYKAYIFRNCENSEEIVLKLVDAIGIRRSLKDIFELGEADGTLHTLFEPEVTARYLTMTMVSCFLNLATLYSKKPEELRIRADEYIGDTLKHFTQ